MTWGDDGMSVEVCRWSQKHPGGVLRVAMPGMGRGSQEILGLTTLSTVRVKLQSIHFSLSSREGGWKQDHVCSSLCPPNQGCAVRMTVPLPMPPGELRRPGGGLPAGLCLALRPTRG